MGLLSGWAWGVIGLTGSIAMTHGLVRLVEMIAPRTNFSAASQFRSLRFWPFYIVSMAVLSILTTVSFKQFDIFPLVKFGGNSLYQATGLGMINYIIWPIVSLIVLDFFHYWKHRAQHRYFWRFHAIHHSIENLSAINSYHHWTDPIFGTLLAAIPMGVLIGMDTPTFAVLAFLISVQGAFIHSNTRIHLGVANRVLVDNRLHRIHHSVEDRHFDKNFGERSSLWDQLFGTAYFPRSDEWPQTGILGVPEARNVSEYLWRPFESRARINLTPPGLT